MGEKTIPILPCPSIPDVVGIYQALGFEVTHLQTRPNPYTSLRYGAIDLQFFGLKSVDPAASMSTCDVMTDWVDELYTAFRDGLKQALGKIHTRASRGSASSRTFPTGPPVPDDHFRPQLHPHRPTHRESLHHGPVPKGPFARTLHNERSE